MRKLAQTLDNEVSKVPGAICVLDMGGKHRRLVITYRGQSRFVTISASPSDGRAVLNIVGDVRRTLRELGA